MCGIFGIINNSGRALSKKDTGLLENIVMHLMELSVRRGDDASGICASTNKEIKIFKNNYSGYYITYSNRFKQIVGVLNDPNFVSIIGHTRAQTKGDAQNNRNNHPIIYNNTVGVHNGIIFNDDDVFEHISRIAQVDSEAIFALIDTHISEGECFIDAVKKTTDIIIGGYACCVLNTLYPNEIILFRHTNPINIVYINDIQVYVFASESVFIQEALIKSKYFYRFINFEDNSIMSFDTKLRSKKITTITIPSYADYSINGSKSALIGF